MKLNGSIGSAAPLKLAHALTDPAVLAQIAPRGCEIGAKSGETIPIKLVRKFGPIHITLACKLTVEEKADVAGFDLVLHGAHLIGGKVTVRLDLATQGPATGPRRLAWSGELQSSGLAGRLIAEKQAEAQTMLKELFARVKRVVEGPPGVSAATVATAD